MKKEEKEKKKEKEKMEEEQAKEEIEEEKEKGQVGLLGSSLGIFPCLAVTWSTGFSVWVLVPWLLDRDTELVIQDTEDLGEELGESPKA